jgi:hypothetical protein
MVVHIVCADEARQITRCRIQKPVMRGAQQVTRCRIQGTVSLTRVLRLGVEGPPHVVGDAVLDQVRRQVTLHVHILALRAETRREQAWSELPWSTSAAMNPYQTVGLPLVESRRCGGMAHVSSTHQKVQQPRQGTALSIAVGKAHPMTWSSIEGCGFGRAAYKGPYLHGPPPLADDHALLERRHQPPQLRVPHLPWPGHTTMSDLGASDGGSVYRIKSRGGGANGFTQDLDLAEARSW